MGRYALIAMQASIHINSYATSAPISTMDTSAAMKIRSAANPRRLRRERDAVRNARQASMNPMASMASKRVATLSMALSLNITRNSPITVRYAPTSHGRDREDVHGNRLLLGLQLVRRNPVIFVHVHSVLRRKSPGARVVARRHGSVSTIRPRSAGDPAHTHVQRPTHLSRLLRIAPDCPQ